MGFGKAKVQNLEENGRPNIHNTVYVFENIIYPQA
jgi:hypothetical protein